MITTRSQAAQARNPPDTILQAGTPSPFYGVLVSPDHYREFSVDQAESADFKDNLNDYIICPDKPPELNLFGIGGIEVVISVGILAFIGGMVIEHNY